jgi:hypothetical protein
MTGCTGPLVGTWEVQPYSKEQRDEAEKLIYTTHLTSTLRFEERVDRAMDTT